MSDNRNGFDAAYYRDLQASDPFAAANYLDACRLGIENPDDVPARFNSIAERVESMNPDLSYKQAIARDFYIRHKDTFPMEADAAKAMDDELNRRLKPGVEVTSAFLDGVYVDLIGQGKITPVQNGGIQASGGQQQQDISDVEMAKVEKLSTADLQKYLRDKGML